MALAAGCPGTEMPYSVSVPMTRHTLMGRAYVGTCGVCSQSGHNPDPFRVRFGHPSRARQHPGERANTQRADAGGDGMQRG
jgi:hypothetical protein